MLSNKQLEHIDDVLTGEIERCLEHLREIWSDACPNDNPGMEQRREEERVDTLRELQTAIQNEKVWFVTRYRVERCFGGQEEGGWYYDWYTVDPLQEPVEVKGSDGIAHSIAVALNEEEKAIQKENGDFGRHSAASVTNSDYRWYDESEVGSHVEEERPHYC